MADANGVAAEGSRHHDGPAVEVLGDLPDGEPAPLPGRGYALYGEVLISQGQILNPGFRDYKIPTAAEMDIPIERVFVEPGDRHGPFGAKGVGEPGLVPTAPAIANAIHDAVGVRVHDLPITPGKLLAALQSRKS